MPSVPIRFEKQFGRFRIIWFRSQPTLFVHFPLRRRATRFIQIGLLRVWRDGRARKS